MDLLKYENKYWEKGLKYIAGVDEAGRGPLAGPVVAACVILNPSIVINGINDSKKISPKKRYELFKKIKDKAVDVSIGIVNEKEIDDINILKATFLAMKRAVGNLSISPNLLLIDGPYSDIKLIKVVNIIRGDSKSASIGAASIIAKVTRDNIMKQYDMIYPNYGFLKHKGYGTKHHIEQLSIHKATPIHRKSFKIVKDCLPNYEFYKSKRKFYSLGLEIIATQYIKRNYILIERDIVLDKVFDKIDFLFRNSREKEFIKIIALDDNEIVSFGKHNIEDINSYIDNIKNIISKETCNLNIWLKVILVEFKPKAKPQITILNNEKIH